MTSWITIKPAMISLVSTLSGLQTIWIDQRRPYVDPALQAIVLIRVRSTEEIGTAERRHEDQCVPAPAPALLEQRLGTNRVGFDISVESFRHDDDRFAFVAAERIRSKLFFASSLAALRAVGVSVVRVAQTVDLSGVKQDDRIVSIAVIDLQTTIGYCDTDTDNPVYNIESVDNPVDNTNTEILPPC